MKSFQMAVCQNQPGFGKQLNVRAALELVKTAAGKGAELVILPEMFYMVYEFNRLMDAAEDNRETLVQLQQAAQSLGIYLCTGSMAEIKEKKVYNTAYLIDPRGKVLLEYSKTHLFDVELPGLVVKESAVFAGGNAFPVAETALGRIGILICYDIRFPETGRQLVKQGAEIILVPAAFNHITGPAHWHMTFRTRAVENQCFLAAASPALNEQSAYKAYGHSLIIDPWGRILAEAGAGGEIIYGKCEAEVLDDTRARLPLLKSMEMKW